VGGAVAAFLLLDDDLDLRLLLGHHVTMA